MRKPLSVGKVTRWMVSSSTGGKAARKTPTGPKRRNTATRMPSSTSGRIPINQIGTADVPWTTTGPCGRRSSIDSPLDFSRGSTGPGFSLTSLAALRNRALPHLEDPHPSELGELALVGVEHELTGEVEGELEAAALALALGDQVGPLVVVGPGSRPPVPEEVPVQVERVDQI